MCIQLPSVIPEGWISDWEPFSGLNSAKEIPDYSVYFVAISNVVLKEFDWRTEILHIGMSYKATAKLKERIKAFKSRGYRDKYISNCDENAECPDIKFDPNTFYYAYIRGKIIDDYARGDKFITRGIVTYVEQIAFGTYQQHHNGSVPRLNQLECGIKIKKRS